MVEIRVSEIDGANEGLFALQDIEINTVIAFYNGSKASMEDYDPDTWETNNYKIFDPEDIPDGTIDIPVWAQSSAAYCATLAHKTNHSFLPNCQFLVFDHPKFGLIPCISTVADLNKGDEVGAGCRWLPGQRSNKPPTRCWSAMATSGWRRRTGTSGPGPTVSTRGQSGRRPS